MYNCEICGKQADIHHIIHRSEGGFDIELNYKYLCPYHHRGKEGPHHDLMIDLSYKIEMQYELYKYLTKDYYWPKELSKLLGISSNSLKRLLKGLKLYKEGYKKEDIIFKLMGCKKYTIEMLDELAFDLSEESNYV